MSQATSARNLFLEPSGLSENDLVKVMDKILGHQITYADLYFQSTYSESWSLEDGQVKDGHFSADSGVGVRAIANEKTGFAYSEELVLPAIEQAAQAAKTIAKAGKKAIMKPLTIVDAPKLYTSLNPIQSLKNDDKVELLKRADRYARAKDPRIKEVFVSLSGSYDNILVMANDGTNATDTRPLIRFSVTVIAEQNGRRERGSSGGGGRYEYQYLLANEEAICKNFVDQAVHQALINLDAIEAPAGKMPVLLGPGWPGVLLHEAVGHGLEGDFNRKGSSAFSGRIGQKVCSELCTVVDDATLSDLRGSLSIDDEGTPAQNTTLIENGRLVGYMQDKMNASLMNEKSTGNGRRQSYAHLPMPRMTNTYMLAGDSDPQEMIGSLEKGLYAVNFGGGQVDITSGKFVFSANEAYLVENGKIVAPVKGATLIGNGPEVMQKISMVGNDLALDTGVGVCGKAGQSVPVGVGQPSLLIDELVVGGTS